MELFGFGLIGIQWEEQDDVIGVMSDHAQTDEHIHQFQITYQQPCNATVTSSKSTEYAVQRMQYHME